MCLSPEEHDSMRALADEAEETVALSTMLYEAVKKARDRKLALVPPRLPIFLELEEELATAKTG